MIILHIKEQDKLDAVKKVAEMIGQKTEVVGPSDLTKTIRGIYTGSGTTKKEQIPMIYNMPDLAIFVGMDMEMYEAFSRSYKMTGFPPIALKAFATQHNMDWTLFSLIEELKKEHISLHGNSEF